MSQLGSLAGRSDAALPLGLAAGRLYVATWDAAARGRAARDGRHFESCNCGFIKAHAASRSGAASQAGSSVGVGAATVPRIDMTSHCTKSNRLPHHPRIRDGHGSQARHWPGCAKPAPKTQNRHLMRSGSGAGSEVRHFQERGHFRACAPGRMREFGSPAVSVSPWYFRQHGYRVGIIETRVRARPDTVAGLA